MEVLWVTNIPLPKISVDMEETSVPVGGWMVKLADEVADLSNVNLHIMFPHSRNVEGKVESISYSGFNVNDRAFIEKIIKEFAPNVIHIHGTESKHFSVIVDICEEMGLLDRVVVSIQGLMSVYARHYTGFLPNNVVHGMTLRDILKGNVAKHQKNFSLAGELEIRALSKVQHVIGRTDWDRACVSQINANAKYHFCNEMLRDSFYRQRWDINKCERYSIFCSQATSPIKGIHIAIEAVYILKRDFPSVKLYIAGKSYTEKPNYQLSYYEKYVLQLIKKYSLKENVKFTGFLNEKQMCEKYLKSHVFVSASSIENSPNSVCEAMILAMPTVSSMVGGIANLMSHGVDGFYYQADAPYMLAEYVSRIFKDDELARKLGMHAHETAWRRHNVRDIISDLMMIYRAVALGQ